MRETTVEARFEAGARASPGAGQFAVSAMLPDRVGPVGRETDPPDGLARLFQVGQMPGVRNRDQQTSAARREAYMIVQRDTRIQRSPEHDCRWRLSERFGLMVSQYLHVPKQHGLPPSLKVAPHHLSDCLVIRVGEHFPRHRLEQIGCIGSNTGQYGGVNADSESRRDEYKGIDRESPSELQCDERAERRPHEHASIRQPTKPRLQSRRHGAHVGQVREGSYHRPIKHGGHLVPDKSGAPRTRKDQVRAIGSWGDHRLRWSQ